MKKGTTKEEIMSAVNSAKNIGLLVGGNFLFGFPGETRDTIIESIEFAINLDLDGVGFNMLDLYPGTDLWHEAESGKNRGWSISGFLYDWEKRTRRNSNIVLDQLDSHNIELLRNKAERIVKRHSIRKRQGLSALLIHQLKTYVVFMLQKIGIYDFLDSLRNR